MKIVVEGLEERFGRKSLGESSSFLCYKVAWLEIRSEKLKSTQKMERKIRELSRRFR